MWKSNSFDLISNFKVEGIEESLHKPVNDKAGVIHHDVDPLSEYHETQIINELDTQEFLGADIDSQEVELGTDTDIKEVQLGVDYDSQEIQVGDETREVKHSDESWEVKLGTDTNADINTQNLERSRETADIDLQVQLGTQDSNNIFIGRE